MNNLKSKKRCRHMWLNHEDKLGNCWRQCNKCQLREMLSQKVVINEGHQNLMTDAELLLNDVYDFKFNDVKGEKLAFPKTALKNKLLMLIKKVEKGKYDNRVLDDNTDVVSISLEEEQRAKKNRCVFCGMAISLGDFKSEENQEEYGISGLCQNCQNANYD